MTTQVTDVLATYTNDVIEAKLLGYLQSAQTPVTDWHDSGFLRSLLLHWAQNGLGEMLNPATPDVKARQALASGPVPLLAAAPTKSTSAWLTLAAAQIFGVRRNYNLDGTQFAGTFAQQAVTLSCDASHGPCDIAAGTFFVRSSVNGNRYKAITSGTVPNNGSVIITVQSESPNDSVNGQNYADGAGTLTDIRDNPLPGVTASNVGPTFSGVIPTPNPATGLGVVTVGGTPPAAPTAYDVQITTSGQSTTIVLQYRTNGGPWITGQVTTASAFTIPSGPTVTFTNDGVADPSFIAGDTYSFQSPGTPITQHGLDPETDTALLIRCLARWPDLASKVVEDKHVTWAKQANALVLRARPTLTDTPGILSLTIAGANNPLSGAIVSAVTLYINQHEAIGDMTEVTTASVVTITSTGNVYVRAEMLAAVQAAAAVLWNAYVSTTDIGGVVVLAKLEEFLMDAGALDTDTLALNSGGDVTLAFDQVAQAVGIAGTLTWVVI